MDSEASYSSPPSRRRPEEAELDDERGHRSKRHRSTHDEGSSDYKRRARSSERKHRSRTPESDKRRSRERDRRSHGDRDRRKEREDRHKDRDRHRRGRERSTDSRSLKKKHDDEGGDRDGDRERRSRRSSEHRDSRRTRGDESDDEGRERGSGRHGAIRKSGPLPSQADSFALVTQGEGEGEEPPKPKEKPNYGTTGLLAAASNTMTQADGSTIVLKYHEPPEARRPSPRDQWKLFIFRGPDLLDTVELSARSCWLIGREAAVTDLLAEHPSISKQHAVIQFRHTEQRNEFGDRIGRVRPYLIDLESANGTQLNHERIPGSRYLELRNKDVVQLGSSTREYVVMLAEKD